MLALLRGMAATLNPQLEMVTLDAVSLRKTVSKRTYTCVRLRSRSAVTGHGECPRITSTDLNTLRAAVQGKEATGYESIRRGLTVASSALAGLDMAMLDLVRKFTKAAVYQLLGGPTRNQARALAQTRDKVWEAWFGFPAMRMVNGKYPLPEKPGLGFELSEDALKKCSFAGTRPMSRVSHTDGSVAEW